MDLTHVPDDGPEIGGGARVFLAEDDPELRSLLAACLRLDGHHVIEASDGATLLVNLVRQRLSSPASGVGRRRSVVVADVRMPGFGGLAVLRSLREHGGDEPPFILITGFGDDFVHDEARALGVAGMFDKPFAVDDLRALVRRLVA